MIDRDVFDGLIVDLFAGGGGASRGIEEALGRPVDIAINHDKVALAVHKANHPNTHHVVEDIWKANPFGLTGGRRVALLWASPDCKHFSAAKGGKPLNKKIRTLAWAVYRWARATKPNVIFLENVKEFKGWGPLTKRNKPDKRFIGKTFERWKHRLERLGYVVDYRLLDASLYGAPTSRRRLFIIARRDGLPIVWPECTHGPGKLPVRTAAECIDWSLPCPSIFKRKRPLAEKTEWRIAQGIKRFVIENPEPFIVGDQIAPQLYLMKASTLIQSGYGERNTQIARVPGLGKPLGTVVDGRKHALVTAFLNKHYGGVVGHVLDRELGTITSKDHHSLTAATLIKLRGQCHGSGLDEPMPTLTANGKHVARVTAFLTKYYGTARAGQTLDMPMHTITSKHRLGIVTVHGVDYQIVDIGMRMLEPHELLVAQTGRFADQFDLSEAKGKRGKWCKNEAIRLIGNMVCPEVAYELVVANKPSILVEVAA